MSRIRLRGLILFAAGAILTIGAFKLLIQAGYSESSGIRRGRAAALSIPALIAVYGLIELIAGVSFFAVASKWNALDWKVRLGISSLIILGILITCFASLRYYLMN